jgi:hypothetical protein
MVLKGYMLWDMGQLNSTCRAPPRSSRTRRGRSKRRGVAVQVVNLKKHFFEKPGDHFIGSRVETRRSAGIRRSGVRIPAPSVRFTRYESTGFNVCSPAGARDRSRSRRARGLGPRSHGGGGRQDGGGALGGAPSEGGRGRSGGGGGGGAASGDAGVVAAAAGGALLLLPPPPLLFISGRVARPLHRRLTSPATITAAIAAAGCQPRLHLAATRHPPPALPPRQRSHILRPRLHRRRRHRRRNRLRGVRDVLPRKHGRRIMTPSSSSSSSAER